jgi:hypothetical protein
MRVLRGLIKQQEKESRETEIKSLVSSSIASLQNVISRWRQVDGVGALKHFEASVEGERQRYQCKLEALRTDASYAGPTR